MTIKVEKGTPDVGGARGPDVLSPPGRSFCSIPVCSTRVGAFQSDSTRIKKMRFRPSL